MSSKISLLVVWFPLTTALLMCNLLLLSVVYESAQKNSTATHSIYRPPIATATLDGSEQVLGATIVAADARALLLSSYLKAHQSPLADFATYIVNRAQQYGLDYRLVPAIAMCESGGGVRIPTKDSFNAWGISVYTGQPTGAKFINWMYAIDWVSNYIKEKYYDKGLLELSDIGAKWAPPSVENGNSWANCVSFFMNQIQ